MVIARGLTTDKVDSRETRRQREFFARVRRGEAAYAVNLRKIAKHIEDIIQAFDPDDPEQVRQLEDALRRYSDLLTPWARVTARKMLVDVSRRDEKVWKEYTAYLGLNLQQEIATAPTGEVMRDLLNEQVHLITSLPLDAAKRVHELTTGALYEGARANEIAAEIMKTGEVTRSRANLIARTEVGRSATTLTQARAESVGSVGYIWRTARDYDVRKRHKELEGTFHAWNDPPIATDPGQRPIRAHAGSIFNCFPGSTLVGPTDGILRAFRAVYEGPLVVVVLGDTTLEVTPNHPILTQHGWIIADKLQVGDHLVKMTQQGLFRAESNVNDRSFSFEEIFETLRRSGGQIIKVQNALHDNMVKNEVEVIGSELLLMLDRYAACYERFSDEMITTTNGRVIASRIVRRSSEVLKSLFARFGNESNSILNAGSSHPLYHAIMTRTFANVVCSQDTSNDGESSVLHSCDSGCPETALIQMNDIDRVSIDTLPITGIYRKNTLGHVYTLETVAGVYIVTSAGIATKNCRCYAEPVLPGEAAKSQANWFAQKEWASV